MITVGNPLPEIRLQGTLKGETQEFDLSQFKGQNLVLVFFPFAFTPV